MGDALSKACGKGLGALMPSLGAPPSQQPLWSPAWKLSHPPLLGSLWRYHTQGPLIQSLPAVMNLTSGPLLLPRGGGGAEPTWLVPLAPSPHPVLLSGGFPNVCSLAESRCGRWRLL